MPEPSSFAKSLKSPWQWAGVAAITLFFLSVVVAPLKSPHLSPHVNLTMLSCHAIGLAMYSYANDNNGVYPTGKSSTGVFQKLIDGGYVTDPSIFYVADLNIPGKTKATSNHLKPENVCWDVTIPVDATKSPFTIPLIFTTGYRIEYLQSGKATPLVRGTAPPFMAFYVSNAASYQAPLPSGDGIVPNILPADFDANGVKYVQLTPDGPLP